MHLKIFCAIVTALIIHNTMTFASVINRNEKKCYDPKVDFYEFMGTKTAYDFVRPRNKNLRILNDPKCQPMQLWVLARHGARFPSRRASSKMRNITELRNRIIENHENGSDQLCDDEIQELRDWMLNTKINYEIDEELAPQGVADFENFARRLITAYPELLGVSETRNHLRQSDFAFKTTDRQRSNASMHSFAKIIFNGTEDLRYDVGDDKDELLLPHKNCEAWDTEFREKNLIGEKKKFITESAEMKSVLHDVSIKLGFVNQTLDYDSTISTIYDLCRFEVAWNPSNISIWCKIFKKEHLKILEYGEDLDYYYTGAAGREMSAKVGCQTLADMFRHFRKIESIEESNVQPKGIFYFGHSVSIQTMLAAMGIGKETTPFTWSTYASLAADRKYRSSKVAPFATNIVAVLFRCNGDDDKRNLTYKVSLHLAESPISIDGCENGLCDWEVLKKKYDRVVDGCDMKFCRSNVTFDESSSAANVVVGIGSLIANLFVPLTLTRRFS